MAKFRNKYRIESNRMPGWDYSGNGSYFITMVIQNRESLLGKIENNEMILSDFGKIAKNEWYKSAITTKVDDFIDLHNLSVVKFNRRNKFWQANYNDHVICNKKQYWRIKNYIKNNPENWIDDKFYE